MPTTWTAVIRQITQLIEVHLSEARLTTISFLDSITYIQFLYSIIGILSCICLGLICYIIKIKSRKYETIEFATNQTGSVTGQLVSYSRETQPLSKKAQKKAAKKAKKETQRNKPKSEKPGQSKERFNPFLDQPIGQRTRSLTPTPRPFTRATGVQIPSRQEASHVGLCFTCKKVGHCIHQKCDWITAGCRKCPSVNCLHNQTTLRSGPVKRK